MRASGSGGLSDEFYRAIRENDLAKLDELIKAGGDVNIHNGQGITPLMDAAAFGSADAMKRLISAGADVNARNALGSTALMWCLRDLTKMRLLLARGADVNAASTFGRTPLLVAALSDQSAEAVRLLIAKGADVHAVDKTGMTLLHAATSGNDPETVRAALDARLDVNAKDVSDFTPLMNAAANGNVAVTRMLLARGARVSDASGLGDVKTHTAGQVKNGRLALTGFTALHLAAVTGPVELVRMLLDAGADVNATEGRGMTPLMLSVAADHADAAIVRLLLSRGANVNAESAAHETALDWAQKFGPTSIVAALKSVNAAGTAIERPSIPPAAPTDVEPAVTRAIGLLDQTSSTFFAKGGCAACHAQNIMDVVGAAARARNIHLDPARTARRVTETKGRYFSSIAHLLERQDLPGTPDVPSYSMIAFADAGYTADRMTDAITVNIAAQQLRDGRWHLGGQARPPIQDGDIARTALAVRALQVYAPPARADIRAQLAKARAWLEAENPTTNEDRSMRLLGLTWAGASDKTIAGAAASLLAEQRFDGGWSQRKELTPDAYATGQALYALAVARVLAPASPAYQRGVKFLLRSQRADGSWYVASRAIKFQPYFESGFPYGHDQWISAMGTGWAAAALTLALPPRPANSASVP